MQDCQTGRNKNDERTSMDDSKKPLLTLSNRILSSGGKNDKINVSTLAGSTESDRRLAN